MGPRDGCMFEACGLHRKFQPAGVHSEAVASVLVDLASLYSGGRSRKLELKPAHFLTTVSHCTHPFCVSTAAPALIPIKSSGVGPVFAAFFPLEPRRLPCFVGFQCFKALCWSEFGHHFIALPLWLLAVVERPFYSLFRGKLHCVEREQ